MGQPHDIRFPISNNRYREEALTRTQALRGMTCDAAYAAFAEDTRGRLAPGFAADFVVLDRDIMRVPLEDILGTRVLATVVDGQVAYGSL
jgi:predicted amidohydrolase YtcJ